MQRNDLCVVLPFPNKRKERICGNCEYAYLGPQGVWCAELHEMIFDEETALDCEFYKEY